MSKILGQTFTIGVQGLKLRPEEAAFLEQENIGGVVLFAYNYDSPAQLAELTNDIQKCRNDYPLFIAVDQEGGRVQRFKNGFTHFPPMFDLALLNSPKSTYEVHTMMAKELYACGINVNYSPVCDVWSNPINKVIGDRAFGNTTDAVEKHISAAIRGMHENSIITCAKHFPGHGSTKKDSHHDLPYITSTLEDWQKLELPPFLKAAKSKVEMLMMAHLVVDIFDKDLPCTLSRHAYDASRTILKFDRVIITDDMEMKAIADNYGLEEATVMALNAGADIVLYRSFEEGKRCYEAVQKAYLEKKISPQSIQAKHERIEKLKKEQLAHYKPVSITQLTESMQVKVHQAYLKQLVDKIDQFKKSTLA